MGVVLEGYYVLLSFSNTSLNYQVGSIIHTILYTDCVCVFVDGFQDFVMESVTSREVNVLTHTHTHTHTLYNV